MPRVDSKHSPNSNNTNSNFYSQFSNSTNSQTQHYIQDSDSSNPPPPPAPPKKKHVCPTCDRAFTTSGHLARHSRVHTGERNHKCPFPGCETRCSRQDNLQQHYRIHLSPGSRRSSTRSAIARAMNTSNTPGNKRGSTVSSSADSSSTPPPLSSPPALEPARVYSHHSTPPDSPPPLAHATLPATAHLPSGSSSRSSSSPETSYSPANQHLVPMSSQGIGLSNHNSQQPYSYRSGTATYQEQSQGVGFTYVHTTPVSHSSAGSFSSYPSAHTNFSNHSLPHINTSSPIMHSQQQHLHDSSPNPTPLSSRHSISHISHPQQQQQQHQQHQHHQHQQSYSQNQPSSAGPASPASSHSVSSHTSGPPTPSYVYHEDSHAYHHTNGLLADQSALSNAHIGTSQLVHPHHQSYPTSMAMQGSHHHARYDSPPPTLAPIQQAGERYNIRRDIDRQPPTPSYLHHPQPMSTDYQYHHQSLGLGHGAWKSDSGLRKGVGALVQ